MSPTDLADRLAIQELVFLYSAIPDDRDYARVAVVFSQGARLVGPGFSLRGRSAISQGMRAIERYSATMHNVHNHRATITGNTATGEVYCVANHLHEVDGVAWKLDWGIRYRDDYQRGEDGWRIKRRELRVIWEQDLPLELGR